MPPTLRGTESMTSWKLAKIITEDGSLKPGIRVSCMETGVWNLLKAKVKAPETEGTGVVTWTPELSSQLLCFFSAELAIIMSDRPRLGSL